MSSNLQFSHRLDSAQLDLIVGHLSHPCISIFPLPVVVVVVVTGSLPLKVSDDLPVPASKIRQHLAKCLSDCRLSRFPVIDGERKCVFCTCRMPERDGDKMVQCDMCEGWFHPHCLDIPDSH